MLAGTERGGILGGFRVVEFDPITEIGTFVINGVSFDIDPKSGLIVGENSKELARHPDAAYARKVVMRDYAREVPLVEPMIRNRGAINVDF